MPTEGHLYKLDSAMLLNATLVRWDRFDSMPLCLAGDRIVPALSTRRYSLDLKDHLIFPGLINAHDHLQLNAIPPLQHPEPFPNSYAWIAALQAHMVTPAVAAARALPADARHWHGGLKNLLSGVTTVAHHDPLHPVLDDPAFPVRVLRDFGWSHSLGLGRPGSNRSSLCYGPPIPESFTATPAGRPWIVHLAEGTDRGAATELDELDSLGCLAANTVLVHGVGLTDGDIDRVIERHAAVLWCPGSNLTMLGRTLQPTRLLDAGLLALGSDSRLSGAFDLLTEMRLAAKNTHVEPRALLRLVTEAGSRLLALPEAGGLDPGQWADLLIVRDQGADPYQALLQLRRADIRAVVRGGRPAVADPDFAPWFAACNIPTTPIRLDGRPKLWATALLGPTEAVALEPGLDIQGRALSVER
jgi:cytosine/adenosine deaminase-related metal-dependent hydrolase